MPATVGDGKHLRFRVRQHGRDAGSAIAFGQGAQLDRLRAEGLFDVACRLKENRWNGTVAPQLVVRRLFDTPEGYDALRELARGALACRRRELDGGCAAVSSPSSGSTRRNQSRWPGAGASSSSPRRSDGLLERDVLPRAA